MKNTVTAPAIELAQKLRSSAARRSMLRLMPEHVAILMQPEIYGPISDLEATELRTACRAEAK
jgi:hypothetical protein